MCVLLGDRRSEMPVGKVVGPLVDGACETFAPRIGESLRTGGSAARRFGGWSYPSKPVDSRWYWRYVELGYSASSSGRWIDSPSYRLNSS